VTQKIDAYKPTHLHVSEGSKASATAKSRGSSRTTVADTSATDQVTFTDSARSLQRLEEAIAKAPVVDTAKVAALRESIDRGNYAPSAARIADKIIDFERKLK
jgi:negative regulator of flagellin synthesis FlgM